jgi:NADH-quinone oxidoreductase subunit E
VSVRRLAAEQPESFAFSKDSESKVSFWMNKYPTERRASAVIPLLWLAQKQEGWVSEPAMREIATRCAMPYIRVYEVATFYTMFNLEPVGEHLIQVCGTTPCWLRGADDLKAVCEKRIGKKGRGNISADGKFSWEEVECLGACSNAPMVQIANRDGDYYYEDLTAQALETILDDLAAGKPVEQGPVTARTASEPFEAKVETLVETSPTSPAPAPASLSPPPRKSPPTTGRKPRPGRARRPPSPRRAPRQRRTSPRTPSRRSPPSRAPPRRRRARP